MASVAAARHGAKVTLLDVSARVGGVCSGGLGQTDKGNPVVIGGLADEFFRRNARKYNPNGTAPHYQLEPHMAETVFLEMMKDASVSHVRTSNRSQVASVDVQGTTIHAITLEDGTSYTASVFIDASYEGDLMARSGADSVFGREPRSQYNESYAGRREPYSRMDWEEVSPYIVNTSSQSIKPPQAKLLYPLVTDEFAAPVGSGDDKVQDYNFRLCVTKNKSNAVPFPKPRSYNRWCSLPRRPARCFVHKPHLHHHRAHPSPAQLLPPLPPSTHPHPTPPPPHSPLSGCSSPSMLPLFVRSSYEGRTGICSSSMRRQQQDPPFAATSTTSNLCPMESST
jgi:hypothetical protein